MAPAGRRTGRSGPASADEAVAASLTGGGPSQLGVNGSLRARDVSRPTEADLARAEKLVQVSYRPRSHPRPPLSGIPERRPQGRPSRGEGSGGQPAPGQHEQPGQHPGSAAENPASAAQDPGSGGSSPVSS